MMNPRFNLREICKQCTLLEDHLNSPRKRCSDCIRKHFLTIEALYEEAASLDIDEDCSDFLDGRADYIRRLQGRWLDGTPPREIAKCLRTIRKELAPECFDLRGMKTAGYVADVFLTLSAHQHICGAR